MIVITPGDPCGIGPQVMLDGWLRAGQPKAQFAGDGTIWRNAAQHLNVSLDILAGKLLDSSNTTTTFSQLGEPNEMSAKAAWAALDQAIELCKDNPSTNLVTGPIAKKNMMAAGFPNAGHTEYLASAFGSNRVLMMMWAPKFAVGLHTVHIPLMHVGKTLSSDAIEQDLLLMLAALHRLGVVEPRVGVCGLNPHAGEDGLMGDEEAHIVEAIQQGSYPPATIAGPLPGDTAFARMAAGEFDCVLAMYHDQGLGPFKLLHLHDGVNMTCGLPIIRTSPDHGTAFELAKSRDADSGSAFAAIELAVKMC